MALCTVILHGKCGLAIMARPARGTFFHVGHGVTLSGCAGSEYPVMAVATAMELGVERVAESGNPSLAHRKCHFHG